ncbi:MAG: FAD-dependent tricarballylate dehydrogenase TcuA [candidate division NC10 bacterium]|nr:FAD-dependent tricarballylate dehydrogenase TcuA [candidate division NC10 bacterium]
MGQGNDADGVIVVGGGNAGLCAALSAREQGARVLVVEKAPESWRGGNTFFTAGAYRFAFGGLDQIRALIPDLSDAEWESIELDPYPEEQFFDDMMRVTEDLADPELAMVLARESFPTMMWLREKGVRWILMFGRQAYKVDKKFRFWGGLYVEAVGGGTGIVEAQVGRAEKDGIEIRYGTKATRLLLDQKGSVTGLEVKGPEGFYTIPARAVVLSSGGFQANAEMRTRYLGKDWDLARVRGTPFNTGDGIRMALEAGAQPFGHWSSCHAVAWDYNSPPYGDRKVGDGFQKHSYPLGIIVNLRGERFLDEGADFRNYTYAKYGGEILKQPRRAAFQLFDSKVVHMLRDEYRIREVTKATADTIEELAGKLEIDGAGLMRTVREFNAAVQEGPFNPAIKDGKCTKGISPPKSNWALRLDTPPFVGYHVTCGITFTFGGLRVDLEGRVQDSESRPIPGLYAAGELVGGLFYNNYPGGAGLMAGAVFGRLAGREAGRYARSG